MAAAWRGAGFFGLWLVLAGTDPKGLLFGLPTAVVATRASLALLPASGRRLLPGPALRLALGIGRDTLLAGIDIARRAFDPRLPLCPGVLPVPLGLPPGAARDGFLLLASLQPGALPAGLDGAGRLVVHVLDTALPVTADMHRAEALFAAATGREPGHG